MVSVNTRRVWLGALAGGAVWNVWSIFVNVVALAKRYEAGMRAGMFLQQPRYRFFLVEWIVAIFLLAFVMSWLYASVRATRGPGPGTALKVGLLVGFVAAFPLNFSMATWSPLPRIFPFWWMLELWVGAILATFVAGWLYQD
jgi:hypothetical protein